MKNKMKGIRIGVTVKKKCDSSYQESSNGETQKADKTENVYVNDPESHGKFVKNIFSILKI